MYMSWNRNSNDYCEDRDHTMFKACTPGWDLDGWKFYGKPENEDDYTTADNNHFRELHMLQ